jgi:PAS domain-containing protein
MESPASDFSQLTLAVVEAQVGSLVDYLPVALLVCDADGRIMRANRAAIDLFDAERPLVGATVAQVLPFADHAACDQRTVYGPVTGTDGAPRTHAVRLRWLRHGDDVLRLYVIHEPADGELRA